MTVNRKALLGAGFALARRVKCPAPNAKEIAMEIDKSQIIELLKSRGEDAKAGQAEADLPDKVDTDKDSGLFEKYGLNPQDLMGKLPGGLGGLGG